MGQYGEKKPEPVLLALVLLAIWSLVALSVSSPLPAPHPQKVETPSGQAKAKDSEPDPGALKLVKRDVDEDEEEIEARMEYGPMLISKKSATVLNRLVNAMRSSFDQAGSGAFLDMSREKESMPNRYSGNNEMFNLQRRTQKDRKGRRCYFNAVSCF